MKEERTQSRKHDGKEGGWVSGGRRKWAICVVRNGRPRVENERTFSPKVIFAIR
jgi:hypothetical protein